MSWAATASRLCLGGGARMGRRGAEPARVRRRGRSPASPRALQRGGGRGAGRLEGSRNTYKFVCSYEFHVLEAFRLHFSVKLQHKAFQVARIARKKC